MACHVFERPAARHDLGPGVRLHGRPAHLRGAGRPVCASFIVSSGAVKTVGKLVMALAGQPVLDARGRGRAVPAAVVRLGLRALRVAAADALDEAARVRRAPMDARRTAALFSPSTASASAFWSPRMSSPRRCATSATTSPRRLWSGLGYGNGAASSRRASCRSRSCRSRPSASSSPSATTPSAFLVIHGVVFAGLACWASPPWPFRPAG